MNHKQSIPGLTQRLMQIIDQDPPFVWAARMGIAKATMHGLLRQASPTTATLVKIARQTDVSISWLLTGQGPERIGARPASAGQMEETRSSSVDQERFLAPDWGGGQTDDCVEMRIIGRLVWIGPPGTNGRS